MYIHYVMSYLNENHISITIGNATSWKIIFSIIYIASGMDYTRRSFILVGRSQTTFMSLSSVVGMYSVKFQPFRSRNVLHVLR